MAGGAGAAVDFGYLESFTAGDRKVVDEILTIFRQQADIWVAGLQPQAAEWAEVVHTIKGAARGVGAFALGDACARAEEAGPQALDQVRAALAEAVAAMAAYQSA